MMAVTEQRAPCKRVNGMPVLFDHLAPIRVIQTCVIPSSNLPQPAQGLDRMLALYKPPVGLWVAYSC